jgi:hypothetical protein
MGSPAAQPLSLPTGWLEIGPGFGLHSILT